MNLKIKETNLDILKAKLKKAWPKLKQKKLAAEKQKISKKRPQSIDIYKWCINVLYYQDKIVSRTEHARERAYPITPNWPKKECLGAFLK